MVSHRQLKVVAPGVSLLACFGHFGSRFIIVGVVVEHPGMKMAPSVSVAVRLLDSKRLQVGLIASGV